MKLDVFDIQLAKVSQIDLPDDVFGVKVSEALLWEQVKAQRASWRRGTHATKKRGAVSGGGAKPYKQKGTGRARQGSNRAPNHVGGGCVFGPQPRDYSYRLPRSARKAALRSALSVRCAEQKIWVLDQFALDKPRTKDFLAFLSRLQSNSALIVDCDNDNLALSVRNVPKSKYLAACALNVYDIINHECLVLTRSALQAAIDKARAKASTAATTAAAS